MSTDNSHKHLTLNERKIIEQSVKNGATKASIAQVLGKDKSTISKEIKLHGEYKQFGSGIKNCARYETCRPGVACPGRECGDYLPFKCSRRDRSPGACNGCSKYAFCRYDKFIYHAEHADAEYRTTLVDSRAGENLTVSEAQRIADIVRPLLEKGQSPYQIIRNHPELGICEKTLYNYIENGTLHEFGLISLDLRRQPSRRMSRKKSRSFKKREDRAFIKNRTYDLYLELLENDPNISVVQMDTVYNDITAGPYMQTFKFLRFGFLFAVFHDTFSSEEMVHGIDILEALLGHSLFINHVGVILTDRGTEFSKPDAMETSILADGARRTSVFYCDPMRSNQKGSLENNHELLRYICPKQTDLRSLGLDSQDKLNLALSHINSSPMESLLGKSPLEMMKFMAPDLFERFESFGIVQIEKDMVTLKPYLLK